MKTLIILGIVSVVVSFGVATSVWYIRPKSPEIPSIDVVAGQDVRGIPDLVSPTYTTPAPDASAGSIFAPLP